MIEINNLYFKYPDGTIALKRVNARINKGTFLALIGQNGSGKTTFSKCISGILKPTKGSILIDEEDIANYSIKELRQKIGYVFQNPDHQIFSNSVIKELRTGPENLNIPEKEIKKRINEVLEIVGLSRTILKEDPFFLPKGVRQKIAIASILTMRPEYLIVDEPTTGQDYRQSIAVMEFLKKLNKKNHTIIIITHEMHIVKQYAKEVMLFSNGRILSSGSIENVFARKQMLKKARIL